MRKTVGSGLPTPSLLPRPQSASIELQRTLAGARRLEPAGLNRQLPRILLTIPLTTAAGIRTAALTPAEVLCSSVDTDRGRGDEPGVGSPDPTVFLLEVCSHI